MATKKKHIAAQQFCLPVIESNESASVSKTRGKNSARPNYSVRNGESEVAEAVTLSAPHFFSRLAYPRPTAVYRTYWKFAKARQDLFFARLSGVCTGVPDAIIQRHRFTNAYRASDRVSQYLIRHVLYDANWSAADLVFRLLVFKFFNKIETWESLQNDVGKICCDTYDFTQYDKCLNRVRASGRTIYSAAYIMPSGRTTYGYQWKHRNHLKVIEAMMAANFPARLIECKTLASVFELLRQFPCVGPFIGYQFAIDLNYSRLLSFSENEFVEPGPGALDGIAKCFASLGDLTPADIIRYMTDVQEDAFGQYAPGFQTLWGRPLQLIDCQNLFCEVSKYARVAHPEIAGLSNRTRIKQVYRPSPRALERPWFPPKWGLNDLIAADQRLQAIR